jgi:hypothetical protein
MVPEDDAHKQELRPDPEVADAEAKKAVEAEERAAACAEEQDGDADEEQADESEEDEGYASEEDEPSEEEMEALSRKLRMSMLKVLARRVYSDNPPPKLSEEIIGLIPEIPCTQVAADFVRAAEKNIELLELQAKAARRVEKLKYLEEANRAKRCEFLEPDGESCRGPALRGTRFCRFHDEAVHANTTSELPVIEDQRSLQLAFNQVAQRLSSGELDPQRAKVLAQVLDKAGRHLPQQSASAEN